MIDGPRVTTELPGPASRAELAEQERLLFAGLVASQAEAPFVTKRKVDHWIEDVDGNVFLNLAIASGSQPLGPAPAAPFGAAVDALGRFGMEGGAWVPHTSTADLAERLVDLAPPRITRVAMALNGTESIEGALRLMRAATGRPLVLSFMGQYHGETTATVGAGAQMADVGRGQRVLNPGFVHAPYPDPYRSPLGQARPGGSGDATVDYIRHHLLRHEVDPADVAGVLIEPVIGAGGVVIPPDAFWPALTELCAEHGWLLCVDEVKAGMGRTGRMFSFEHWGVEPDLICLGKALGGGVQPIGALLGTEDVLGGKEDVGVGSPGAWTPAACGAALAGIDLIESLLGTVEAIGEAGRRRLLPLLDKYPVVGDVRILGAYWAIEFVADTGTKRRWPEFQRRFEDECMRRGLVAQTGESTYKVLPPYTIPLPVLEAGMDLMEEAIVAALEGL